MENGTDSGPTQHQPNLPSILTQLGLLPRPSGTEVGESERRRPASPDSGNSSLAGSFAKQTDGVLLQEIPSANSNRCSSLTEVSGRLENEQAFINSELVCHFKREFHTKLSAFVRQRLRHQVFWALGSIEAAALECLKGFVLQAYDLAHDLLVTPRRLEFAKTQEARLYEKLTQTAKQRQPEILKMISDTLKEMRDIVPEMAARDLSFFPFGPPKLSNDILTTGSPISSQQRYSMIGSCPAVVLPQDATGRNGTSKMYSTSCCHSSMTSHPVQEQMANFGPPIVSHQDYTNAMKAIRDYVLSKLTNVIAVRLLDCLEVLRLSCIGTLERTIEKLEHLSDKELYSRRVMSCPFLKRLTNDDTPGELVRHATDNCGNQEKDGSEWSKNFRITASNENLHYPWSFNSTTDEFRGLERSPEAGEHCVGSALRALLTFTYELTVPLKQTTNAQLSGLFDKLRSVFVGPLPWRAPAVLDATWTTRTARSILNGLCENAIARKLSAQVTEKLRQSHEEFLTTLHRLEVRTEMRNCRFEDAQENIIRQHAPRLARIVLEMSALRHYLTHGLPSLGKELGRGQYGVVYACSSWGGHSLLAVKSVVPPDEKHWRDLAMELFYSRQLPQHDRIATVHAHVIDYDRAHGTEPAVLLIMERLARDLHIALKQGLSWLRRLIVARDVAEGVRYLHSQGLIHRDIKPRNVLLDLNDRAKLTDLGFCKPQAMIGGSILGKPINTIVSQTLGTPLHMAPEILQKQYDYTVDIYAWGILFWYICAGSVHMPRNFDKCTNKEVLWSAVRKGKKPTI
ncbi:non-specific serine/threonine protein kinase [Clonorchis sinensis]|uniref:Dual serine/threonine and tyrosine protein kinase n=1 Tax=Clonorchis sinensis TaxID=79923 RepID=H2KUW8_CLOSI|nr:non-specific serine/threonine protein kinase [Clonorchis sinensis]